MVTSPLLLCLQINVTMALYLTFDIYDSARDLSLFQSPPSFQQHPLTSCLINALSVRSDSALNYFFNGLCLSLWNQAQDRDSEAISLM